MKLAAVLACRNQSTRLYAKPLQCLDVENKISVLDYMISQMKLNEAIDDIVLAISEGNENLIFKEAAKIHNIPFVIGSQIDVLGRLVKGAELVKADNVLRVTSESPYVYYGTFSEVYEFHCKKKIDYSVTTELPDGASLEVIRLDALKKSWDLGGEKYSLGGEKYRSEYCTTYIFDHQDQFKIARHKCHKELAGVRMRLTIDYPEDLIVMREIYSRLKLKPSELLDFNKIIEFLKKNPKINGINNWIDSGRGRIWY